MANYQFDLHATVDAAKLLYNIRLQHSGDIPLPIWRTLAHAEKKLNREIELYFNPDKAPG